MEASSPSSSRATDISVRLGSFSGTLATAMTRKDAIAHWQRGAQDSLEAAEVLSHAGKYTLVLFHCHLAVEKALKAAVILRQDSAPPPTHNLILLAAKAAVPLDEAVFQRLAALTHFVIDARYDDPGWADQEATREKAEDWLQWTSACVRLLRDGDA